jgi:hypothetical protein
MNTVMHVTRMRIVYHLSMRCHASCGSFARSVRGTVPTVATCTLRELSQLFLLDRGFVTFVFVGSVQLLNEQCRRSAAKTRAGLRVNDVGVRCCGNAMVRGYS